MKKLYRVAKSADGKWHGTLDGYAVPLVVTHLRDLAAEEVFRHARDEGDARVLLFNTDGECVEERTFGAGARASTGGSWD